MCGRTIAGGAVVERVGLLAGERHDLLHARPAELRARHQDHVGLERAGDGIQIGLRVLRKLGIEIRVLRQQCLRPHHQGVAVGRRCRDQPDADIAAAARRDFRPPPADRGLPRARSRSRGRRHPSPLRRERHDHAHDAIRVFGLRERETRCRGKQRRRRETFFASCDPPSGSDSGDWGYWRADRAGQAQRRRRQEEAAAAGWREATPQARSGTRARRAASRAGTGNARAAARRRAGRPAARATGSPRRRSCRRSAPRYRCR